MGLQRVYRCHFRNSNLLSSEIRLCVAEHVTMWSGSQKIFSSLVHLIMTTWIQVQLEGRLIFFLEMRAKNLLLLIDFF